MKEMICIVCPRGCHLSVGDAPEFTVSGNFCPRGELYGREELTAPKRTVTATCPLERTPLERTPAAKASEVRASGIEVSLNGNISKPRRVPVRTRGTVPREKISELVSLILQTEVALPVHAGDVIIENWENSGVSVIVTRALSSESSEL